MKNIFYVYVYLDPRKSEGFNYEEFYFDFEPFYVGKGQGIQWRAHLGLAQSKTYNYKLNKIRKIQSLGLEPKIIKYKENLTEQGAFDLEKKLIKIIGRLDLGTGPLTNLTDGGDGVSGVILSKETRQKMAISKRGRTKETHPGVASMAEKMKVIKRGRTKETHPGVASMAEKKRGRTKETHPGVARMAEKVSIALVGRTAETYPYIARRAEVLKGRTKEDYPYLANISEKLRGRTKETDVSVARRAEKLKGMKYRNRGTK